MNHFTIFYKLSPYLIALISLSSCKKDHSLNSFVKTLDSKKTVAYDIDYAIKTFDGDDTLQIKSRVFTVRVQEDSIFGGAFWYTIKNERQHYTKYYDLSKLYIVDHNLGKVTSHTATEGLGFIKNRHDGQVLNTYFSKPERLLKITDTSLNRAATNTKNNGIYITSYLPDDDPVFDQKKTLFINTKENYISHISFEAHLDNEVQYNTWDISNVVYDDITLQDLKDRFKDETQDYIFEAYKPLNEEDFLPLAQGTIAPELTGEFLKSNKTFDLRDYKGKIVVLDFWYKACQPCVEAIPSLKVIKRKFKPKNVEVLGVNPVDTDSIKQKKLRDFIDYKEINYPTILTERQITQDFKVHAFPTLYIINEQGEIVFSKVGYTEDQEEILEGVLNDLLVK